MKSILINKRRRMIVLLSVIAVAALAVGITIAWFSDTEQLSNVAQVKSANITLAENVTDPTGVTGEIPNPDFVPGSPVSPINPQYTVPLLDASGNPVNLPGPNGTLIPVISPLLPGTPTNENGIQTGANYPAAMPGASYVKAPAVTNEDQPVFLRFVITRSWTGMTGGSINNIILHPVNPGDWTYRFEGGSDVFYYNSILATDATTSVPFDFFTISNNIDNTYLGARAQITVVAQALQASGLSISYANAAAIPSDLWAQVVANSAAASIGSTGMAGSTGGDAPS